MACPIASWRSSALSACAGLILVALVPALPASAQERMPPVPPDKYDAAQKRVAIIPDVATTSEQGLRGVEASVWNAFFFPKGTPEAIVRKLNKAMSDTLDDPAIRNRLEELGLEIVPAERRTPEYLAQFVPAEIARWAKPIREAGISAE